jgi:formylglycine-generating enzyme required for sulfatase activity
MAKLALLIGVSECAEGLTALPAAVRDIEAMATVLADANMGGFEVTTLPNPSRSEMERAIEILFENRAEEDLLLLYFSGHGFTDQAGKFFFSNRETRKPGRLVKSTATPANFVHDVMEDSNSDHQVVILDCCHSGAFGITFRDQASIDFDRELGAGGKGRIVLASSAAVEYSIERKGEELAVYTQYLVAGIKTGAADLDGDGAISVNELHDYVCEKVSKAYPAMHPERYVHRDGDKILLARAVISDPEREYRKQVKACLADGMIYPADRRLLDRRWKALGLKAEVAAAIEAEELRPYEEHRANLQEYEEAVREEAELEFPLTGRALRGLTALQKELKLTDEIVAGIQDRVLNENSSFRNENSSFSALSPGLPRSTEPLVEALGNNITLEMLPIPGGKFLMGSPETEADRRDNESPQHEVTIAPFYMSKFPITQAQWKVVAALPKINRDLKLDPSSFKGVKRPVEQVSWWEAIEFCDRLSQKTGSAYRLPSEAEWEYACRAGTTTPFYFGETISKDQASLGSQTTDVGSFPANAFGLHDMHGNVWEWCLDHWHSNYEGAPLAEPPGTGIDGSAWLSDQEDTRRVLRGGSWFDYPLICRSAYRNLYSPDDRDVNLGFRVECGGPRTL